MKQTILLALPLLFLGCEDYTAPAEKGLHFQGRNCIACHNTDLKKALKLVIAGTLFKNSLDADGEDLNTLCQEDLLVNFLENNVTKYSSKTSTSKGTKGKGNFFILDRENKQTIKGEFIMQITSKDKKILAQSTAPHTFSNKAFDKENVIDYTNRYSCNSCHTEGIVNPLYPNKNQKCK